MTSNGSQRSPATYPIGQGSRLVNFPPSALLCRTAFTLIEIMVAVGIIAMILAMGIPSVYQQLHKDGMRKAVVDVQEACSAARGRAVLDGVITELKIRPGERTITVSAGSAPANESGSLAIDPGKALENHGGGGGSSVFSMKFSDRILIEFIGVNLLPDLQQLEEVSCYFYPNGTSDELVLLLRSDIGEIRKMTTDVVTGILEVEVVR